MVLTWSAWCGCVGCFSGVEEDILAVHARLADMEGFGLDLAATARALDQSEEEAKPLFDAMDDDHNGLVDSFELMGLLTMAGQTSTQERVRLLFDTFDFDKTEHITKDELVIMHSTLVTACCKFDKQISTPPVAFLEDIAQAAFTLADIDTSGEITMQELQGYVSNVPQAANFMEYWDDCLAVVDIPEGQLWEDPEFGPSGKSLYKDEYRPPRGAVPASQVEWLRPGKIFENPKTWQGVHESADMVQGSLGDRWVRARAASLFWCFVSVPP